MSDSPVSEIMTTSIQPVLDHLLSSDPGGVVCVYLYGSAATSGLQQESDIDLLVLTRQPLTSTERDQLVSLLLGVSGWSGHTSTFPEAAGRRPLELTVVTLDDVQERSRWPRRDFQYGEWMRGDLVDGFVPQPGCDPDLVILFATALESHLVLHGQPLEEVLPPVPRNLLQQAQLEILPELLDGFDGDERNVLLTLARMIVTTESGTILPKHEAVERILPRLNQAEAELLILARDEYLGKTRPDWSQVHDDGFDVAQSLRRLILNVADFS